MCLSFSVLAPVSLLWKDMMYKWQLSMSCDYSFHHSELTSVSIIVSKLCIVWKAFMHVDERWMVKTVRWQFCSNYAAISNIAVKYTCLEFYWSPNFVLNFISITSNFGVRVYTWDLTCHRWMPEVEEFIKQLRDKVDAKTKFKRPEYSPTGNRTVYHIHVPHNCEWILHVS